MKTTTVRSKGGLFVVLMAALLALTPVLAQVRPAQAQDGTCTVTGAADSGDGTLRALLPDTSCDTINFASDMTIRLAGPLAISRAVTIDGGGHAVTISGDSDGNGTADARVFEIASGSTVFLRHLTITKGYRIENIGHHGFGGAISNNGELTVSDCSITESSADYAGGIYNGGTLTVLRSIFTGNSAEYGGGAIYNDAYLGSNTAATTVTGSVFSHNTSKWTGPTGSPMYFVGTIGGGGAIANMMGTVTVADSAFTGNNASSNGGAIANAGPMAVTNNTFSSNTAVLSGGAIFTYGGTLTNNTFAGNAAASGLTDGGGAIWFWVNSGLPHILYNNLLVQGSTGGNCYMYFQGNSVPAITSANNLADDSSCATDLFTGFSNVPALSSQVGTLGSYGGSTQTIPLLAGSVAIDAGDNAHCPATDQRGVARPQGAGCDVGAFEYKSDASYSISGTVFEDVDKDGTRDAGEPGLALGPVNLYLSYNGTVLSPFSTYSSADGSYSFTGLTPLPAGYSVSVGPGACSGPCRISLLPAPITSLSGDVTGVDIGLYFVPATLTPTAFTDGVLGVPYNQTITVTGGDPPYVFTPSTASPPPPGLTFDFDPTGTMMTLSGTPTKEGTFRTLVDFVGASGYIGQLAQNITIHPPMEFSPKTLPDGALGVPYQQTVGVSGGLEPYSFREGSEGWLPAGMIVDTSSGAIVISGTPTEAGEVHTDIYVTDQTGTEVEVQHSFWVKTDPSLILTSSRNPSLQGEAVTFSLGSSATVANWPAPWGQVTFYADGAVIPGCDGLWLGSNAETEQDAPNPVLCTVSALAAGNRAITAAYTANYGPYNSTTSTLAGGQTVNTIAPRYTSAGLGAPIDLGNVLNSAKAGQMIPLKWRLLDGSGNPVTNLDPVSVSMTISPHACPAGTGTDAIETYASGTSALQNLGDGYYQMNWKTDKAWVTSCKQLTLKIGSWTGDGFTALFEFKK